MFESPMIKARQQPTTTSAALWADCKSLSTFPDRGTKHDEIRPNLRTKGYTRRATIAFSVNDSTEIVVIHGVFYGGQDFEQLLRDTDSDD